MGVIKNVIPAIASTNSIIAAETVMEAIKIFTGFSKRLDNYFMYMGHEGLYSSTMQMDKLDNCKTCSKRVQVIKVEENDIWKKILEKILEISRTKFDENQEINIWNVVKEVYKTTKGENGQITKISCIDDNKTLKELIDENIIDADELFEIIPKDDKTNVIKIKLYVA